MVDTISSVSQTQATNSINRTQKGTDNARSEAQQGARGVSDDVSISEEAISLAQAEGLAREAASSLSNDKSITLSSDRERLELLA